MVVSEAACGIVGRGAPVRDRVGVSFPGLRGYEDRRCGVALMACSGEIETDYEGFDCC